MLTDSEIANDVELKTYKQLAEIMDINPDELVPYTNYMAKLPLDLIDSKPNHPKLVLVTSISPTKAGIGKTTTSIGLAMALNDIYHLNAIPVLREPSLGPCFGQKGGACGGGHAQVLPMDKINLHFTGDFHAVTSANNLIAASLDNYLYQNKLQLKSITWKRVIDMNDRSLRNITVGLGKGNGISYDTGFDITPASEIMAILCLATSLEDLRNRIDNIILGYNDNGQAFLCKTLGITGSVVALLKDAMMPNLVQTIDGYPAIIHGGPFANIAHGCNSVIATKMGMTFADIVVTEAGFGADLGAEKFYDIKCRLNDIRPDLTVVALTLGGLMYHSGFDEAYMVEHKTEAIVRGLSNLAHHVHVLKDIYNQNVLVAINKHDDDTKEDLELVWKYCKGNLDVDAVINNSYRDGAIGAKDFAEKVKELIYGYGYKDKLEFAYDLEDDILTKLKSVCTKVYHISEKNISFTKEASKQLNMINDNDAYRHLPVCIAKTQYSFSDNPKDVTEPTANSKITFREIIVNGGAGFIVAIAGDMMRMPGLPKVPAATKIDVNFRGDITGLS